MIKKLIEKLKQSGIDVQILETIPVNSDKGHIILNDLTNMSADYMLKEKKRTGIKKDSVTAPEKSIRPQSHDTVETVSDKSTHSKSNGTVVSESDAKIDKILRNLESHYQKSPNYAKGFITDVARKLAFVKHGQSQYRNFKLPDGQILSVRLSKHNAKVSNFDKRNERLGLSIIISPNWNKHLNNDGIAHVTEWYYSKQQLESVTSYKPLAEIIKSLRNALLTGEYIDTTGLGVKQEVNAEKMFMQLISDDDGVFYSNAQKAVMAINQNRATPAQWLAMLNNKGGIKAGEDKWLGLSEWLRQNTTKSLDKAEILDYINANCIRLHEDFFVEIEKSKEFKDLNDEYVRIVNEAPGKWRTAHEEFTSFYNDLKNKYGDEWEDCMTDKESFQLESLEDEMKRFDDSWTDQYERAFEDMVDKYGRDFDNGFSFDGDKLEVIDKNTAERFLDINIIDETRLEYTTEGLDNYHELAFWAENADKWEENDSIHFGEIGQGRCIGWVRFGNTTNRAALSFDEMQAEMNKMPRPEEWVKMDGSNFVNGNDIYCPPGQKDKFIKTDFIAYDKNRGLFLFTPQKGVPSVHHNLNDAVAAFNRRNIPKYKDEHILVIDEIQSKRHQEAQKKDKRYQMDDKEFNLMKDVFNEAEQNIKQFEKDMIEKYNVSNVHISLLLNDEEERQYRSLIQRRRELGEKAVKNAGYIPRAPFEKNWHELCMKRMLRYAAENGYDKMVWTNGQQQGERYDLKNRIDNIEVYTDAHPAADDKAAWKKVSFMVSDKPVSLSVNKKGMIVNNPVAGNITFEGKSFNDVFGKDCACMIMDSPVGYHTIDLDNVHIENKGIKLFYDRTLPDFVNKYGRQWGVQVKDITILDKYNMHGIDISEDMKKSVMQGQPMFMRDKKGRLYGFTRGDSIFLTPEGLRPETIVHEYTHIWATAMADNNPEGWQSIKNILKETSLWDEVKQDPLYMGIRDNDDYIASEALARISGKSNAAKLEEIARQTAEQDKIRGKQTTSGIILNRLRSALGKFWSWVGTHMFNIKQFNSVDEVTDRVLYDLLNKTQIKSDESAKREADNNINHGKGRKI